MAGLKKLRETSFKMMLIKFAKLIATNKLSKVAHAPIYVQVTSTKSHFKVSDDEIELDAAFDDDYIIPSELARGDILKLIDWRFLFDYQPTSKEITFKIIIENCQKIGRETVGDHLKHPEEIADLHTAYTILHRFYEASGFDYKHDPDDSLKKIKTVLCQTNKTPKKTGTPNKSAPGTTSAPKSKVFQAEEEEKTGRSSTKKTSAKKRNHEQYSERAPSDAGVISASKLPLKLSKLNDQPRTPGGDEPKRSSVKFASPLHEDLGKTPRGDEHGGTAEHGLPLKKAKDLRAKAAVKKRLANPLQTTSKPSSY